MNDIFETDLGPATPITERQEGYIVSLREQYDSAKRELSLATGKPYTPTVWGSMPKTRHEASLVITLGKMNVSKMRSARNAARETTTPTLVLTPGSTAGPVGQDRRRLGATAAPEEPHPPHRGSQCALVHSGGRGVGSPSSFPCSCRHHYR